MIKSLRQARVTDGLPRVLAGQVWVTALSEAVGAATEKILDFSDNSQIYTGLDSAPEEVLDALAGSWKVEWYDSGAEVEEKRRVIRSALQVRRLMGTARAVRLQADAVYPGATVSEWFDYGGAPGYFRVSVNVPETGMTAESFRRLIRGIFLVKNVRSHLEDIDLRWETETETTVGGCTVTGQVLEVWPEVTERLDSDGGGTVTAAVAMRRVLEVSGDVTERVSVRTEKPSRLGTVARQIVEIYPEERGEEK